jgi:hypothetical protein
MLKIVRKLLAGAVASLCLFGAPAAMATVGTAPLNGIGFALQDGQWLLGLAGGQNYAYINGISAAGTTQATATQLTAGYALYETDTVASSTGVALPACFQGTSLSIYNNGAQTLTVYPSIVNNSITAAQDTINNTTSVSVNSHTSEIFGCAKNGVWSAK